MKKSLGSFINLHRTQLLLLGVVLGITAFGAIAWNVGAQDGSKSSVWTKEEAATRVATMADRLAADEQSRAVNIVDVKSESEAILGSPEFFSGSLTTSDPTFVNPGGSTAGTGRHYYDVFQFTVAATGPYTIEMSSLNTTGTTSNALDTFLRVYANSFVPAAPGAGIASNDDFTGTLTVLPGPYTAQGLTAAATGFSGTQPSSRILNLNLTAGTQYFLVLTSFRNTDYVVTTGSTAQATGPYWVGINPGVEPAGTPTPTPTSTPTSTPTATPTGTPVSTPTPTATPTSTPTATPTGTPVSTPTPTATPTPPPGGSCTPANTVLYGYEIDGAANNLIRFTAAAPGTIGSRSQLTGLGANEFIVGMDFRPATSGFIYGVTGTFPIPTTNRVVAINTSGGPIVSVGAGVPQTADQFFGVDFNPVPDRIRVVGDADTNRRLNPNDGTLSGTDTNLAYAPGDPGFGVNPNVVHVAYTNSQAGAATTTLYGIDSIRDTLVRIGGQEGPPSPNTGLLTTIGPLGVDITSFGGFDIQPFTNNAYAALFVGSVPRLYSINLATGAATLVGTIGSGTTVIDGLTIAPCSTAAGVEVSGRVITPDGRGLRNAVVSMADSSGVVRTATTSTFGYYRFDDVTAGESYIMSVESRRYRFSPRSVQVFDNLADVDFFGQE